MPLFIRDLLDLYIDKYILEREIVTTLYHLDDFCKLFGITAMTKYLFFKTIFLLSVKQLYLLLSKEESVLKRTNNLEIIPF